MGPKPCATKGCTKVHTDAFCQPASSSSTKTAKPATSTGVAGSGKSTISSAKGDAPSRGDKPPVKTSWW